MNAWESLNRRIVACRRCPRLINHCQQVAEKKRPPYQDWEYWGKPVPNLGQANARLLIVGLAPGAHGANRTGRMFTGDSSGDWLFRALHKADFANQPTSRDRNDGLRLIDCAITAVCHCAPPDNKPSTQEITNCQPWLTHTIDAMNPRVFLALGGMAWNAAVKELKRREWIEGRPLKFGHGSKLKLAGGRWLLGSYHVSRQNTNTYLLTEPMLDAVFAEARRLLRKS